jgi:hypothetical protein
MYESRKDVFNSNLFQPNFNSNLHNYSNFRNVVPPPIDTETVEKPKDEEILKKKTNRKKLTKPIHLEEILENDNPKEKKNKKNQKTVVGQNVNIKNKNPCIINQNNYYNGYNMPHGHRYNHVPPVGLEIPNPAKFMDKNKPIHPNMMDNNYMYMPRMPMYYYPNHMPYEYGIPPRGNEYKKPK